MFKNAKIGTKIIFSSLMSFILGIVILVIITSIQVQNQTEKDVENLLIANVNRYSNYMQIDFQETSISLNALSGFLAYEFSKGNFDIERVTDDIGTILNSGGFVTHAFLYIPQPTEFQKNINSKFITPDGKFLAIFDSSVPSDGLKIIQADDFTKDWFESNGAIQKSINEKKMSIGLPRIYEFNQNKIFGTNIATPIYDAQGKVIASIGFILPYETLSGILSEKRLDIYKGNLRFVLNEDGNVAMHINKNLWGKSLYEYIPQLSTELIKGFISSGKEIQFFSDYIGSNGLPAFMAIRKFNIQGTSDNFYMVTTAPRSEVLASLYKLQWIAAIVAIVIILAVSALMFLMIYKIIASRIGIVLDYLHRFFKYINHETSTAPAPLPIKANDELGQMATAINENIRQTKLGFEQDNSAV
ncbi:cache domain-containing protein, partial [Campylobacter cuniculorum]